MALTTSRSIQDLKLSEGDTGAQALAGSRLATSAGESTPSMKFGQILMNMLIKAQQGVRPGIESLQAQQRGLQTEQAQRMATTPESLIGASPSLQSAARGASVSALEPSITGTGQRIKTLSQQLESTKDLLGTAQNIWQIVQQTEQQAKDDTRNAIRDAFTFGGASALEPLLNQPDIIKKAGYDINTFTDMVKAGKAKEANELAMKQKAQQTNIPTSYKEWQLAGGLEGTGRTYSQFLQSVKPASQAEQLVAEYTARIEQAEPTINSTEGEIAKMNPLVFDFTWDKSPTFQSNTLQQYMQAARNFINAKLRRESGAVISPTEFEEARKQYLPQPGDNKETLKLKKANRSLIMASLKKASGSAYSSVEDLLGNQPSNSGLLHVRRKSDGQPGRITYPEFNPELYEIIP